MLNINNLTKKYNKIPAVDNVSLEVEAGQITVLLGPNGAGKSTMMKSITGMLRYEGEILICGMNNKTSEARSKLGFVPEMPYLYDLLTPMEHMEFMARAYNVDDWESKAEELLKRFDLLEHQDKMGDDLSKGMRQKVSICCALITNPEVVLFDEPMIGLDPQAIRMLKQIFIELKNMGKTVLISTHIIDSVDEIWDKAYIMHKANIEKALSNNYQNSGDLEKAFFDVVGELQEA